MTLSIDELVADIDETAERCLGGLDLVEYRAFRDSVIEGDLEPESIRSLLQGWSIGRV